MIQLTAEVQAMHENAPHTEWQVHQRCTSCDVARQLAPDLIGMSWTDGRSFVMRQPATEAEQKAMYAAAYACHVRAIQPVAGRLDRAADPYPMPLDEHVYLCGHNSPQTIGANSYLLRRPAGNLMMVDTPQFSDALAKKYEAVGDVTDVLLTHRDHAAHGCQYAERFGARLWIHEGDLDAAPQADQIMRGTEPIQVADGVIAHPLPGHTEGNVIYVADDTYCFSGDSFYWSRSINDVAVFETVTWLSIRQFAESLRRTVPRLRFEALLPGHGDRVRLPAAEMARRLTDMADRAGTLLPQPIDYTAVRY
jgi:glyoxylase-like metal-dependent hydrolase (beta-lactamase superfamily II)